MSHINRRTGAIKVSGRTTEHFMTLGLIGVLFFVAIYIFGGPEELLFWVDRTLGSLWDAIVY